MAVSRESPNRAIGENSWQTPNESACNPRNRGLECGRSRRSARTIDGRFLFSCWAQLAIVAFRRWASPADEGEIQWTNSSCATRTTFVIRNRVGLVKSDETWR